MGGCVSSGFFFQPQKREIDAIGEGEGRVSVSVVT